MKDFGAVGKCIYCGNADIGLSDEHIIPFGLSGEWVRRDASCKTCADITSAIEGRVLRHHLIGPRAAMGLKTRRPDKRPTQFEITRITYRDGKEVYEKISLPAKGQLILLACPIFAPPRILTENYDEIPQKGISLIHWSCFIGGKRLNDFVAEHAIQGFADFDFDVTTHSADFALMIGKIAYSYVVASLGIDCLREDYFSPLLLGKTHDIGKFIGNAFTIEEAKDSQSIHRIVIVQDKDNTLIARVRLFAKIGAPEYLAVVGKAKEDLKASKITQ